MVLGSHSVVIVAGKSGAGKQARINYLARQFGLEQLSTGNIFRYFMTEFANLHFRNSLTDFFDEAANTFIADETAKALLGCSSHPNADDILLGMKAKYFIDKGHFVPDSLTNSLFAEAFAKIKGGVILDGYPRSTDQAAFLLSLLSERRTAAAAVIVVDSPDDVVVPRTLQRRICPSKQCGKVFNLISDPPHNGSFCTCGREVVFREEDKTERQICNRLLEFETKTLPALSLLFKTGIPEVNISGNLERFTAEEVKRTVDVALSRHSLI